MRTVAITKFPPPPLHRLAQTHHENSAQGVYHIPRRLAPCGKGQGRMLLPRQKPCVQRSGSAHPKPSWFTLTSWFTHRSWFLGSIRARRRHESVHAGNRVEDAAIRRKRQSSVRRQSHLRGLVHAVRPAR